MVVGPRYPQWESQQLFKYQPGTRRPSVDRRRVHSVCASTCRIAEQSIDLCRGALPNRFDVWVFIYLCAWSTCRPDYPNCRPLRGNKGHPIRLDNPVG